MICILGSLYNPSFHVICPLSFPFDSPLLVVVGSLRIGVTLNPNPSLPIYIYMYMQYSNLNRAVILFCRFGVLGFGIQGVPCDGIWQPLEVSGSLWRPLEPSEGRFKIQDFGCGIRV